MAITTLAGILSGINQTVKIAKASPGNIAATGVTALIDFWNWGGFPKAGAYDTTLNGVTLSGGSNFSNNITGQLPYCDPASGNGYIARASFNVNSTNGGAGNNGGGAIWICDRLWHNQVANTGTSAQSITTPTWPSRDANGATSGDGIFIALVNSVGGGGSPASPSISYTNSGGTSGRTASGILRNLSSGVSSAFMEFGLQAGDTGVKSVESFTWGTAPAAGTWNLVAYRVLCRLPLPISLKTYSYDAVQLGFPRIYNGSVLFMVFDDGVQNGNQVPGFSGVVDFAQG